MNKLQKTGAVASMLLGALFIGYIVLLAVVLPAQGLGPGTLNNPATGIPFVAASALPLVDRWDLPWHRNHLSAAYAGAV